MARHRFLGAPVVGVVPALGRERPRQLGLGDEPACLQRGPEPQARRQRQVVADEPVREIVANGQDERINPEGLGELAPVLLGPRVDAGVGIRRAGRRPPLGRD